MKKKTTTDRTLGGTTAWLLAVLLLFAGSVPIASASIENQCFRDARPSMGTLLQVTICGAGAENTRIARRIFARVAVLDQVLTTWAADGPALRFNAGAGGGPQLVHPDLFAVLRAARFWAERTGGAFDPAIGRLLAVWREAGSSGIEPSREVLAEARRQSGYVGLEVLADGTAALRKPGMAIDLGAIGKGWALDTLAREIDMPLGTSFLFDFGGSSYLARGAPPDDRTWRVEIRREDGTSAAVVPLRDQALSVSGALGRVNRVGGRMRSHIIDPRTGMPVEKPRFAIVRADDATAAEVLSTAFVVLEETSARALLNEVSAEALVTSEKGAEWRVGALGRLDRHQVEKP